MAQNLIKDAKRPGMRANAKRRHENEGLERARTLVESRSHVLRGNAFIDALRRKNVSWLRT